MKTSGIIVAAGKGKRMKMDCNKQYILLEDLPIIAHTIQVFEESKGIDEIILVVGADEVDFVKKNIIEKYDFRKITHVVDGGDERQDSVYKGLCHVGETVDIVLIHDGARPFITEELIERSIDASFAYGGSVVAVPVKDTIKVGNGDLEVIQTPLRSSLWSVQTPQGFKKKIIVDAYENLKKLNLVVTDDSMAVEALGYKVKIVEGSYENIKITTPEDLILGEGILKNRRGK